MLLALEKLCISSESDRVILFNIYDKNNDPRFRELFYYKSCLVRSLECARNLVSDEEVLFGNFSTRPYSLWSYCFHKLLEDGFYHFSRDTLKDTPLSSRRYVEQVLNELQVYEITWYYLNDFYFVACQNIEKRKHKIDFNKIQKDLNNIETIL